MDQKHESINNFLDHIEVYVEESSKSLKSQLASLQKTLDKIESSDFEDSFFAFENADLGFAQIKDDLKRKMMQIAMRLQGYPQSLNYVPLSWQKSATGLPAFIILPLDSSEFTITVEAYDNGADPDCTFDPELPEVFTDLFENSLAALENVSIAKEYCSISISAQYTGIVPKDVRKLIKKALDSGLFDELYIITEGPTWEIDDTRTVSGRAVIVGWVEDTAQMFIITIFDPEPLDSYLKDLKLPTQN